MINNRKFFFRSSVLSFLLFIFVFLIVQKSDAYEIVKYPLLISSTGNEYVIKKGDTLWNIAESFFGFGYLWFYISDTNNISRLANGRPLIIEGQKINIPLIVDKINLNLLSQSDLDYTVISKTPQVEKNYTAVGPSETLPGSVTKYILGPETLVKTYDYSDIVYINGESAVRMNFTANTAPVQAFIDKVGGATYSKKCSQMPLQNQSLLNDFSSYVSFEQCIQSNSNSRYAYRAIDRSSNFFEVVDGVRQKNYQFVDQLSFNPSYTEYSYRALDKRGWFIVTDGKEIGPFEYVHTLLYIQNGDLYYLTRSTESDRDVWSLYNNGELVDSGSFIDNIIYTKDADSIAYRIKNLTNNTESWQVKTVGGGTSSEWGYVDQLFNNQENVIHFRARNNDGQWCIVRIENSSEFINMCLNNYDEIYTYYFSPSSQVNSPNLVFLKDQKNRMYLYNNENIRYSMVTDINFDSKGENYVFRGRTNDLIDNKEGFFVVNGKLFEKVFYNYKLSEDQSKKIRFFRAGYDEQDNLVLYTIVDVGTVKKQVFSFN